MARVDPVVEGDLQQLGQVEVAGQDVGLLAEGTGLDATAGATLARVLDALAHARQLGHDRVGIEHRGVAVALADDPRRGLDEGVGGHARDLDVGAGLDEVELVDDLEEQVGHLAHAIAPSGSRPAMSMAAKSV